MNKEILRRPFPPELIKQREGQEGKMLSYLETHVVIERLNDGCDAWSFEVVQHQVYKLEVVVVGKLTADGVIKMAFGGSAITFTHAGKVASLADDLKAAASDALKKCASLLGVGLELYARKSTATRQANGSSSENAGRASPRPSPGAGPAGDTATEKQLSAISGICRRKNVSRAHLVALIEQRTGKHQLRELTRREASALLSELVEPQRRSPPDARTVRRTEP
jgi:hypothetical protein